jgi:serine/threonine protein phosphatase 1
MFSLFRRSQRPEEYRVPAAPRLFDVGEGRRVYAIGDIHGRCDLLEQMILKIVADQTDRAPVKDFRLILLGDLIDRGPESAAVVETALALSQQWPGFTCVKGNHEEVFADVFTGDPRALRFFRAIGRDTLLSYGMESELIDESDDETLHREILAHVPEAHRDFITDLPNYVEVGDYLFVHAGIRPGIPVEEQDGEDLRWIREDFLASGAEHPHMVVHGHSITEYIDEQPNRIGIDTGAYISEKLTAIGLEGMERWFLST